MRPESQMPIYQIIALDLGKPDLCRRVQRRGKNLRTFDVGERIQRVAGDDPQVHQNFGRCEHCQIGKRKRSHHFFKGKRVNIYPAVYPYEKLKGIGTRCAGAHRRTGKSGQRINRYHYKNPSLCAHSEKYQSLVAGGSGNH